MDPITRHFRVCYESRPVNAAFEKILGLTPPAPLGIIQPAEEQEHDK